ncbi:MAG: HigA family addiction module antitoxin [Gemmatimonadota bacterium]|nr:HigA family addiction module antitoxin [Gemmatimonadota bacterium]MDE2798182.1 HigA family addiction module antitoxin [Gemmatimonadota bacterium]MYB55044.1 HigA family addiction module antidote protein [Gemmatimonadota bacterium]MYD60000.1 HigA family addiction module antidote protein [Gemmatimonadota bacterium]
MPMKNPPHPGKFILEECLEPLGLSITEAAEGLGVTRTSLSRLIHGHNGISTEMAVRLSKAFGGSAESWLRQQMNYDLAQIQTKTNDIRVRKFELV